MNALQPQASRVLLALFVGTAALLLTTIRDLDDPSRGIITPDYEDLFRTRQLLGASWAAPGPARPSPRPLAPRFRHRNSTLQEARALFTGFSQQRT